VKQDLPQGPQHSLLFRVIGFFSRLQMGYLENPVQACGLIAAMLLLILEALFFNRLLGGLPYPLWRSDPQVSRRYGALAGMPDEDTFWQQLTSKIFRRR